MSHEALLNAHRSAENRLKTGQYIDEMFQNREPNFPGEGGGGEGGGAL